MKFLLATTLVVYALTLVTCANSPTKVLVIESSACSICKYFNSRDIKHLTSISGYDQVVQISLNPCANLVRGSMNSNGNYNFTHRSGDFYLRKAFAQVCVNNLYTNDRALKWAAATSNPFSTNTLEIDLANFFSEDKGAKMLSCINGSDALNYTTKAYTTFTQFVYSGRLPQITLDGLKTPFVNNSSYYFLENICRQRNDRAELSACTGLRESELKALFEESYVDAPSNGLFDYESFWNTPDDE